MLTTLTTLRPLLIQSNGCDPITDPPVAGFFVENSCVEGPVVFVDTSSPGPTAWYWEFPGGTPSTSTDSIPTVQYSAPGNYEVRLSSSNNIGASDTISKTITLFSAPAEPLCQPSIEQIQNNYGLGIVQFIFADINSVSGSSTEDGGNMSFTCSRTSKVEPGQTYPFTVNMYPQNKQYVSVYIDFNNNGDFTDQGERVFASSRSTLQETGNITIPSTVQAGSSFTLRVIADYDKAYGACDAIPYGQAEDYTLFTDPSLVTSSIVKTSTTSVLFFPNPLSEQTTVELSGDGPWNLQIRDLTGRVVYQNVITTSPYVFKTGPMQNGVYFFSVTSDGNGRGATGKIVVAGK
jgi:PKD repeat protein